MPPNVSSSAGKMAPISVVITSFNEGALIEQAVESVLKQSRSDLIEKIVIIDDGSGGETLEILSTVARRDPRIEVLLEHGNGQARNRNIASRRIDLDWIALLDGDDIWLPQKLQRQWNFCRSNSAIGLVYSYYYSFRDIGETNMKVPFVHDHGRSSDTLRDYFRFDGPIIPSTVLLRRSAFEAAGGFDPNIRSLRGDRTVFENGFCDAVLFGARTVGDEAKSAGSHDIAAQRFDAASRFRRVLDLQPSSSTASSPSPTSRGQGTQAWKRRDRDRGPFCSGSLLQTCGFPASPFFRSLDTSGRESSPLPAARNPRFSNAAWGRKAKRGWHACLKGGR